MAVQYFKYGKADIKTHINHKRGVKLLLYTPSLFLSGLYVLFLLYVFFLLRIYT